MLNKTLCTLVIVYVCACTPELPHNIAENKPGTCEKSAVTTLSFHSSVRKVLFLMIIAWMCMLLARDKKKS